VDTPQDIKNATEKKTLSPLITSVARRYWPDGYAGKKVWIEKILNLTDIISASFIAV
jgi:hypothetical protein